ncbi:outer membrane lipoprotein chaperone LolA [Actinobacillus equuli]|uniref:outer membrane lipoprotein chaperone LolA n=1 Tax=Actinobacillus equuli TaxID=718 RepID=UPI002418490C|nr:outer membrane lipoprotein chaperone LolA [Actinobacillus equuli]MDG4948371.1 outer membrane lipoprotein chaperone LolA [Actinobacillus equuli subsp. haemolyticus]WGE59713.1 outer membrane lipoprotein chaperone LolA [Actinobacillus equuli subsp. haemolyticus]WGE61645.1 outer membrane lipoprotein chaperone LolA [Actinobacillus equuli subsp. haemolyticus]
MKKLVKQSLLGLALFSMAGVAFADAQSVAELQRRLEQVSQYSADFDQTVRSSKGKQIQSGKGKFQVKRPNLFRMDTKSPQENLIVSDGANLWFYDPFVSQVTVNTVQDAVNNTPFVLLTSSDKSHWDQYDVTQNADTFVLKPKSKKSNLKQFDVRIDQSGMLKGFSTIERDGQSNLYVLRNITGGGVSSDLFKFSVPKGAELDDQRGGKKSKK